MELFNKLGKLGEIFKKYGITTDEELNKALKETKLNIGMFVGECEADKDEFSKQFL